MRRAGHTLPALTVVLFALGITTVAAYVNPTGLFKVNGHHLYLTCVGTGKPVVILDPGLSTSSSYWPGSVLRAKALHTRVCAYDRYGLGQSDGSSWTPKTRTIDQAVNDLHALVRSARLKGPYVFAGWATGGLIGREYARRFPKDVAGMVQLDAAADDWDTYTGTETFTSSTPYGQESLNFAAAETALRAHDSIGAKPLVVVEAGDDSTVKATYASDKTDADFQSYWDSSQRSLARISRNSIFVVAVNSAHNSLAQDAPGLTVEALRLVVHSVRSHTKLARCAKTKLPKLGGRC
ncbi:MAG: alpha/beta hydrolase [Gaiellaceae bacterium]|jgi:pimeloyl-ACP methyl ester carboxylesterase